MSIFTSLCKLALALVWMAAALPSVHAQTYPSRPIALIVIGPPGGITDQVGRLIAQRMSERLGQSVVVENRPGAGGNIGAEYVLRANPDGHTIFLGTQGTQAVNQYLYRNMRFDPEKEFVPVHGLISMPNVLLANSARSYRSLLEFVDYARQNPNKVAVAYAGSGNGGHMALEMAWSAHLCHCC